MPTPTIMSVVGEYENELKQVIGDTKAAYDISEHDTLIFGSHGLLVAGDIALLFLCCDLM